MSEPFLERLSRFTPDAGGLDRDALLFAAGRASARPNRGWVTLASLRAGTQALSLGLLWPRAAPPADGRAVPVAAAPESRAALVPRPSVAVRKPVVWWARDRLKDPETGHRPPGNVNFIDRGLPLRAFTRPPASLLN